MKNLLSIALVLLSLNTNSNCIDTNILVTNNLKDSVLNVGDFLELIGKDFDQFKDIDGIETDGHVVFSPNRVSRPMALIIKIGSEATTANKVLNSYMALKFINSDVKKYVYSSSLKAHCVLFKEINSLRSNTELKELLADYGAEITNSIDSCTSFK